MQLESPHSVEEIKQARAAGQRPVLVHEGQDAALSLARRALQLGVNIAWFPGFTHHVLWAALWDFMNDFQSTRHRRLGGFRQRSGATGPIPSRPSARTARALRMQQELEKLYFGRR